MRERLEDQYREKERELIMASALQNWWLVERPQLGVLAPKKVLYMQPRTLFEPKLLVNERALQVTGFTYKNSSNVNFSCSE